MGKLLILICMVIGAIVGLFTAISDGIGLKLVMSSIGVIAGAAIGSAFSSQGKKIGAAFYEEDESFGQATSASSRLRNFWRDKGRTVRFMEPPDFGGTHRDFDQ